MEVGLARRFFSDRTGTAEEREHICFDCRHTIDFENFREYIAAGGDGASWKPTFTGNERFNYFWGRRPAGAMRRRRVA